MASMSSAWSGSTIAASSFAIWAAKALTGPTPSITAATALWPDISPAFWSK
jgi:hypothetical protein